MHKFAYWLFATQDNEIWKNIDQKIKTPYSVYKFSSDIIGGIVRAAFAIACVKFFFHTAFFGENIDITMSTPNQISIRVGSLLCLLTLSFLLFRMYIGISQMFTVILVPYSAQIHPAAKIAAGGVAAIYSGLSISGIYNLLDILAKSAIKAL